MLYSKNCLKYAVLDLVANLVINLQIKTGL